MQTTPATTVTPAELHNLLTAGECCLVDVREPVEHYEEHLPQATLIPIGELERRCCEINTSKPIVVMCRGGMRGAKAQAALLAKGFTSVSNLEGGLEAWKSAGQPVSRPERKVFPLMRQVQIAVGGCVLLGSVLAMTVDPRWVWLCAFFGAGFLFAGITGFCGLALILAKAPWNNAACHTGGSCCR
jgi:rhodanese-related sulfurtransferase